MIDYDYPSLGAKLNDAQSEASLKKGADAILDFVESLINENVRLRTEIEALKNAVNLPS